ncbi:MAG TPA: 4'-phosphopantetheinyl transferase superfamily protein [Candidatus Ratteibacteria bacterium]|jgi:phosphopantetheine--protein transferase-like protein|uniref:Holo-(Acyl-carrier-protein) synthase n=1 Tax=candidate division TA06 bacterium ADurb.Bin131 TaxID=1852827 RepID=A0A1V6CE42_UNCT6|nr:MAG: Holo-(acyl-carrier-protein) synthase [candidate division TA06 bacterium ADurb.Bin131]HON05475.1 4'-phosphopantetheinyl transferase superfamily protein [bacterium]HPC28594.1 4'-phosphopantetheinyl transferase superfamily protein [bacterium]HRS05941.1 4'-phosphopantetheinyl transferase superfamily protein [Candidatus Ratteibacteria bacterium]HRV04421.1 4'-phosphopantetheinyl transferase superfamily protein [Candidatus Ratteibacteria bacterium]
MLTKKVSTKNLKELSSVSKKTSTELGVDILERKRIEKVLSKHPVRFIQRVYTIREIKSFPENKEIYYSIGFSLKEAIWKTLPPSTQKRAYFGDIEIIWNKGKTEIFLFGKKTKNLLVSFSFDKKYVLSSAIRFTRKHYD